jgi:glycerophosphoryl diester phosphodiesterase
VRSKRLLIFNKIRRFKLLKISVFWCALLGLISILFYIVFIIQSRLIVIDWEYISERDYNYIAHASGVVDGLIYTNSQEAVKDSISKGFRIIEVDIIESTDNQIYGGHDWDNFTLALKGCRPNALLLPLSSDIKENKIFGKYSVIDYKFISDMMSKNPKIMLFFDRMKNYSILHELSQVDRFLVEIYGVPDYIRAVFQGISRPVYSINLRDRSVIGEKLRIFLLNVKYVTLPIDYTAYDPQFISWLYNRDIKIFLYTINNPEVSNYYIKYWSATVYTDHISPISNLCTGFKCVDYVSNPIPFPEDWCR